MRLSRSLVPTLKETPSEAQIASHRLMLRAGLVRQTSAGIYAWLPLGFRVLKHIERIVREEGRLRRARVVDANNSACGVVAGERPLRGLRERDAANPGPARAGDAVRPDQRGDDNGSSAPVGQELPGVAPN